MARVLTEIPLQRVQDSAGTLEKKQQQKIQQGELFPSSAMGVGLGAEEGLVAEDASNIISESRVGEPTVELCSIQSETNLGGLPNVSCTSRSLSTVNVNASQKILSELPSQRVLQNAVICMESTPPELSPLGQMEGGKIVGDYQGEGQFADQQHSIPPVEPPQKKCCRRYAPQKVKLKTKDETVLKGNVVAQWFQGARARQIHAENGKGVISKKGLCIMYGSGGTATMTTRGLVNNVSFCSATIVRIHSSCAAEGKVTLVVKNPVLMGAEAGQFTAELLYIYLSCMNVSDLNQLLAQLRN